ncbi:hypothetical protein HYS50_03470 [Candidatus Woesearchaeota archaeon]|nr:hypothetical protein [Candidatus Woesearchaeota archaeon]
MVLTHFPSGVYNCILFPSGPEFLAWVEEKKDYPGSDGATRQEALAAALWDAEEAATTVH